MTTIRQSMLLALPLVTALMAGTAQGASRWDREGGGPFTPVTPENQAEFYARSNRCATVRVDLGRTLRAI